MGEKGISLAKKTTGTSKYDTQNTEIEDIGHKTYIFSRSFSSVPNSRLNKSKRESER